ncbi:MAG: DNRLRE domain-containing protein [Myxococcaceae bacterium]
MAAPRLPSRWHPACNAGDVVEVGMRLGARAVGSGCARVLGVLAAMSLLCSCGQDGQDADALMTTFLAAADSEAAASEPGSNFGSETRLRVDGSPERHVYLAFEVSVDRPVQNARLQLFVVDPGADGPELYVTGALGITWTERGLTWDNRPVPVGQALQDLGAVGDRTWVELDVTSVVQGSGAYSFVLVSTSGDGANFASREMNFAARAPRLVVTVAESPPEG